MATIEQIRDAMHSQPFKPFTVHIADGRSVMVKHPDFISVSDVPRGRDVVVYSEGRMHRLDLLTITDIESPNPD